MPLTPEQRVLRAKIAANARWTKEDKETERIVLAERRRIKRKLEAEAAKAAFEASKTEVG